MKTINRHSDTFEQPVFTEQSESTFVPLVDNAFGPPPNIRG